MTLEKDHALHPSGQVFDISYEALRDYHTDYDSGDSHSSLELFRESPARYAAIRVFRKMQPDPPSPAARFGLALHALMLEYDKECRFAVRPSCTRIGTLAPWGDVHMRAAHKHQLTQKDVWLLWNTMLAICNEPDAWNLLVLLQGWNERIFSAVDPASGLPLKCKPDRVLENGLVVDLKTVDGAVDPESWSRTLSRWGYHRQAAFYLDVLQLAGQKADAFVFVAVSKDPPHEIGIYPIGQASLELGRRENAETLAALAECRKTGVWKHEWQGKILTVDVPRWRLQE